VAISYTQFGDNPENPGVFGNQYYPDQLIVDPKFLVSQPVELTAGTLPRGSVLGEVTTSTIVAAAIAGNTGNGTVGAMTEGVTPKYGAFTLKATSPTVFSVTDPEGVALPNATVGTAYTNAELNFTITAGGTAFVAGDGFTLTALNTVGNVILSVRTASDGSQNPVCILADYADASAGPVKTGGYFAGEFNMNAINVDPSWTPQQILTALAARNIHLKITQGSYSNAPES
jgi:hypothetical protein